MDSDEKLSKKESQLLEKLQQKKLNGESLTPEEEEIRKILLNQQKTAKLSLSKTCISYLREEVFIYMKYGKRIRPGAESLVESTTRIQKGSLVESMAIDELSRFDGIKYRKNDRKYRNKWVCGIPDINHKKRLGDRRVIDIKCSWDIYTFMNNLPKDASLLNKYQVQGYIALTNADVGEICHVLVSAPEELIEKQVAKLRYKNVFSSIQEYEQAAELTRRSMRFDDIPLERRIIRFPVVRDESEQQMLFERVDLCREWLMNYQRSHEEYFKNSYLAMQKSNCKTRFTDSQLLRKPT